MSDWELWNAVDEYSAGLLIGSEEVLEEALAGLNYRGRAPQTVAEWELIWRLLRAVLGDENGEGHA